MRDVSNLDLLVLSREFSALKGGRIQKIHGLSSTEYRFEIFVSSKGEEHLIVDFGKGTYLTTRLRPAPETPPQFVMSLRKHLSGTHISGISQHGIDRVLFIDLESKEGKLRLVFELFAKGNLILLGPTGLILKCLRNEQWKDRTIRPKFQYIPPASSQLDPRQLSEKSLASLMNDKKLIACLAQKLSIGTVLVEEVLTRAGIDFSKKASELSRDQIAAIYCALKSVISELESPSPRVYYENEKAADFSPIKLLSRSGLEEKEFPTLSAALDDFFAAPHSEEDEKKPESGLAKKRQKLEEALAVQIKSVSEFEGQASEAKKQGDALFEHYAEVEAVVKTVRELHASRVPWPEMKTELAKRLPAESRLVKEIRAEGGIIVFSL